MKLSRRSFLKSVAAVAGVTAAGIALPSTKAIEAVETFDQHYTKIYPAAVAPDYPVIRQFPDFIKYLEPRETPFTSAIDPGELLLVDNEVVMVTRVWGGGMDVVRGYGGTYAPESSELFEKRGGGSGRDGGWHLDPNRPRSGGAHRAGGSEENLSRRRRPLAL